MPKTVHPVAARTARVLALRKGDRVDVVNVHGGQVVDTWAFPVTGGFEYMSMEHSRIHHYRLMFRPGDVLYTNRLRPILAFVEDRSPGIHDTLCPACCAESYRLYYGVEGHHDNCSDNLRAAMKAEGIDLPAVPTPWNLFMQTVVEHDRELKDYPSEAKPGDFVSLRAEMDCLFAVSACPQDIIVINGSDGRPRGIELHVTPAEGGGA
ncbi:urea carboxylase-associated family protein [Pseudomonas sp. R2.Fl]|nr:urea carboxylase-associated family protein [Pseudomonas sp. R2.Fl]